MSVSNKTNGSNGQSGNLKILQIGLALHWVDFALS